MSSPFPRRIPATDPHRQDQARDDLWVNAGLKLQQLAQRRALLADLLAVGVTQMLDELLAAHDEPEDDASADRRWS
jgi:hypothetical protein